MSALDEIYQEVIIDHFKHPRCRGCLNAPSAQCCLYNPLCGDQIELTLTIVGDRISDVAFAGHGCSISQAAASMMSSLCRGKLISEAKELSNLFKGMMRGERDADDIPELGDAVALQGVRKFSARVKCAMLAWEALEKCLEEASSAAR